jgi:hypothetical protein
MKNNIKTYLAIALAMLFVVSCKKNENEAVGTVSPVVGIGFVKALHNGDDINLVKEKLMNATQIAGIVISDKNSGNFDPNEFVLQNTNKGTTAGLVIKLNDANTSINYGDSVKVEIENCVLTRENGVLKVRGSSLNLAKVTKVSSNNVLKPTVLTPTQLFSQFYTRESTLIQINNVTIPDLVGGEVFGGEYRLSENLSISLFLNTSANANFAQNFVPMVASFIGIPTYYNATSNYYNTARLLFKMPNENAVFNQTGSVYLNFPEDFELAPASAKSQFLMPAINNKVAFKTGTWKLYQAVIGDRVNLDKFNPLGKQAIRLQEQLAEAAYLEMDFDLPKGASQLTFSYAAATPQSGTAVASSFKLEYSQDGGITWLQAGETLTSDAVLAKEASFALNIRGAVRFRINKLGLGPNGAVVKNGLLNIDDFKVYQNVD